MFQSLSADQMQSVSEEMRLAIQQVLDVAKREGAAIVRVTEGIDEDVVALSPDFSSAAKVYYFTITVKGYSLSVEDAEE